MSKSSKIDFSEKSIFFIISIRDWPTYYVFLESHVKINIFQTLSLDHFAWFALRQDLQWVCPRYSTKLLRFAMFPCYLTYHSKLFHSCRSVIFDWKLQIRRITLDKKSINIQIETSPYALCVKSWTMWTLLCHACFDSWQSCLQMCLIHPTTM